LFQSEQEKQQQADIAAEARQVGYAHQQQVTSMGANPDEERTYYNTQEARSDLLHWQQELDDELDKLCFFLLGLERDGKTKEGVRQVSEPLCNTKFVNDVVRPQCVPYLSRSMINSRLDELTILNDLRNTCNEIAEAMADNHDKYGIRFENYDIVVRAIKNTIKPAAYRALQGWTKKTDSTVIKRFEASGDFTNSAAGMAPKKFLGIF
jgi:hypothetical protein